MIIKNQASEIGDVLRIETDIPLIGLLSLSSFIDDTDGEIANRTFKKSFRYSIDGVIWTQFVDLTNNNIANVQVQSNDYFYAEYLYERIGTDPSDDLIFNSVTLNGQYIPSTDGPAYLASNFNNYFNLNNICSIAWSVNVLEKLYKKGIIPEYIERNLSGDNTTDRDYLDFWRGITHYFALYVCLARQFQFFYQNHNLLIEFVKQRGLIVCEDIEFIDLIYLMEFYYDEIRQRGTRQVFIPKAIDIAIDGSKQVNGEYLRLICYDIRDEFLRNLNDNKHIGFNIGNSSPLYKGLTDRLNVNKYYIDYVADIENIKTDLNVLDNSLPYISIHSDSDSDSDSGSDSNSNSSSSSDIDAVIISNPGTGNSVGIGKGDRSIVINPNLDYEITFFIKSTVDNISTTQAIMSYSTAAWTSGSGSFRVSVQFSFTIGGQSSFVSIFVTSITAGINNIISQILILDPSIIVAYNSTTKIFTITNPTNIGAAGNSATATWFGPSGIDPPIPSPSVGNFSGGITGVLAPKIHFGVNAYDDNDNQFLLFRTDTSASVAIVNEFLTGVTLNRKNKYYFVRGIIFGKNNYKNYDPTVSYQPNIITKYLGNVYKSKRVVPVNGTIINGGVINSIPGTTGISSYFYDFWQLLTAQEVSQSYLTTLGTGINLSFPDQDSIIKIDPYIYYESVNNNPSDLYIYNLRVAPLSTEYSKGFIGTTNLCELWCTNNNTNYSNDKVEKYTREFLIPYNTAMKTNFVPTEVNK